MTVAWSELEALASSGQTDPNTGRPAFPGLSRMVSWVAKSKAEGMSPEKIVEQAQDELAEGTFRSQPDAQLLEEYLRRIVTDYGKPGWFGNRSGEGTQGILY